MNPVDKWIALPFIAGFIPAVILLVLYGTRTRWYGTIQGRALFSLFLMMVVSYLISLAVILFPEPFSSGFWFVVRNVSRFAIALALWNMLRIFLKAQAAGRSKDEL